MSAGESETSLSRYEAARVVSVICVVAADAAVLHSAVSAEYVHSIGEVRMVEVGVGVPFATVNALALDFASFALFLRLSRRVIFNRRGSCSWSRRVWESAVAMLRKGNTDARG